MAYSVYDEGDWTPLHSGDFLTRSITQIGLYRLWVDASALLMTDGVSGAQIDTMRVIFQTRVNTGAALREWMVQYYLRGGIDPPTWKSPDVECGSEIYLYLAPVGFKSYTIKIPWKIYRAY